MPEVVGSSGLVDANRDRVGGDIVVPPLPSSALIGVPPTVPVTSTTVTDTGDVVVASTAYPTLLPPPVPLLSLPFPPPSLRLTHSLFPHRPDLLSRRLSGVNSQVAGSSFRCISNNPGPCEKMDKAADVEVDQFDDMDSEELCDASLRIVVWIEGALNKRDDVSRETVKEMSSDLVRDNCVYLREKTRALDKRARCIRETGKVPEASALRGSARERMLAWMENDPPRGGPDRSELGRLIDAMAGVHSGGSGPFAPGGGAESSASAASASATKEKEKDRETVGGRVLRRRGWRASVGRAAKAAFSLERAG